MVNERQRRQIACIGQAKQDILAKSVVVMVGCGGVGSAAGPILAKLGIGHLFVIDRGHVKPSSLRQMYTEGDIGKSKSYIAAGRLQRVNPEIDIEGLHYDVNVDTEFLRLLINSHRHQPLVILDCTDNIETRRTIETVALSHSVPWVMSGVIQWAGNVIAFLPESDNPRLDAVIPHSQMVGHDDPHEVGTVTAAVEMVGSIAAAEVCKCLWGEAKGDRMIYCNAYKPEITVVKV